MLNYNGHSQPASPPRRVTGQFLARCSLPKWARAQLAANIIDGKAVVTNLTDKQIAALCGISVGYAYAVRNGKKPKPKPTLADRLASASPSERAEAAARLGPVVVWDTMISPLLDQERVTQQAAE
jgi:uncharacterized membrane protein